MSHRLTSARARARATAVVAAVCLGVGVLTISPRAAAEDTAGPAALAGRDTIAPADDPADRSVRAGRDTIAPADDPADPAVRAGRDTIAPAPPLLDAPENGVTAIQELGDRLATAAARNDLRPTELRTLLREDETAWVDRQGVVFFIDPTPEGGSRTTAEPPPVAPVAETFTLHSNPGASLTLLLDFDGAAVSGTGWNSSSGVSPGTHPAWDPAGDGPTFSTSERLAVQQVWAIVAEDYAPFGVDVTTEDPGADALVRSASADTVYGTRVLVTPSDDPFVKICNRACGGVAYLSVFDQVGTYYQPAWVFPQALGNDPKNIAEAASHEAGHNLGLEHDGTASLGYYAGHGSWAPIMGIGYDRPIVQWSAGSYPGANNAQNDVAVLSAYLGARADEASGSATTPSSLPAEGAVIGTAADVDAYLLGTCAAGTQVDVSPAVVAPDLDVRAALVDAAGVERAVAQPASGSGDGTTANGLGATLTVPSTGDGWVLVVEGAGQGSWATNGYDDYGSLGAYTLQTFGCDGELAAGVPASPTGVTASVGGTASLGLAWSAPSAEGDGPVIGYVVTRSGSSASQTLPADARSHTFTGLGAGTTYQLSVRAVNASGAGPSVTVNATTDQPPPAAPSAPRNVAGAYDPSAGTLQAWWTEPESSGTAPITGYAIYLDGGYLGQLAATSRGADVTRTGGFAPGSYVVGVAAVSAAGSSPVSTVVIEVAASPPPAVPSAPRNVIGAYDRSAGKLQAWWTEPESSGTAPITAYAIYLDGAYLGQLGATYRGADVTRTGGFAPGSYVVGVAAVSAAGSSPVSTVVIEVAPPPPPVAPSAPRNVTGAYDRSADKLQAWWTEPESSGTSPVTAYAIYLDGAYLGQLAATYRAVDVTRTGGFAPGSYVVGVAAVSAAGSSPVSTVVIDGPRRPSNDDVAQAEVLTGTSGSVSGDNAYATGESTDPALPGAYGAGGYSVWYSWTPTADGPVSLTTSGGGSGRDTTLAAYTGAPGALVEVATNDDRVGYHAGIGFAAKAGTRYLVAVDGSAALSGVVQGRGPFTLGWTQRVLTVPSAPQSVQARRDDAAATVTWAGPADDGGSAVSSYTVTASPGGAVTTVPAGTLATVVGGLTNGTAYTFTVRASNALGAGPASATSNAVTPAGVPEAAAAPTAVRGDGQATVTWTPTGGNGAPVTGYTITASPGGGNIAVSGDATRAIVTGLANGTAYTFTVRATNAVGDGTASPPSDEVTPAGVPGAPARPTATRGDRQAKVTWTGSASNGSPVTGYVVTAAPGGRSVTVAGTASTANVTGLVNGTAYTFTVRATNAVGDGPVSQPSARVIPAGRPGRVSRPGVRVVARTATVTWTAPSANGSPITRYVVTSSKGQRKLVGASSRKYAFTGLRPGTYTFAVSAVNALGSGAAGTTVRVRVR